MIEQIQFAKLFGVARIDSLLQEMLLGGKLTGNCNTYFRSHCWLFHSHNTAEARDPLKNQ